MGNPPKSDLDTVVKEKAQQSLDFPQHKGNNVQMKSASLVNTRLTGEFKPNLGSSGNECNDGDLVSADSDLSISTVRSLHDYGGKLAMLFRTYTRKVHRLRRQIELPQRKEIALLGGNSALMSIGQLIPLNPRTLFFKLTMILYNAMDKILLQKTHSNL